MAAVKPYSNEALFIEHIRQQLRQVSKLKGDVLKLSTSSDYFFLHSIKFVGQNPSWHLAQYFLTTVEALRAL